EGGPGIHMCVLAGAVDDHDDQCADRTTPAAAAIPMPSVEPSIPALTVILPPADRLANRPTPASVGDCTFRTRMLAPMPPRPPESVPATAVIDAASCATTRMSP